MADQRLISQCCQSIRAAMVSGRYTVAVVELFHWCYALNLMSGLEVLISTLPVKGEESLDLQPPDTASPKLDNFISTPLPD
jgi:hypothetical protein